MSHNILLTNTNNVTTSNQLLIREEHAIAQSGQFAKKEIKDNSFKFS